MQMSEKKPVRVSGEALQVIADQFSVLAQPLRLQLLNELQFGEKTVSELVAATGAAQANVSKHLNLLAHAEMVGRRKEGLNVYYFICDRIVFDLCDLMCSKLRADMERKARGLKRGPGRR